MRKATDIENIVRDGVRTDRAADNLKVHNCNVRAGGFTEFQKRKVVRIAVPLTQGAYARTIRIHELLHANNTQPPRKSKFPELANQAIEDARVHSVYWPQSMPRRADRDCLAAALADMRTIRPMAELKSAEVWNRTLLIALRVMSILKRLNETTSKRAYRNVDRLKARLLNAFGDIITEKLEEILGKVRTRKGIATKEFAALMRDDEEQPDGSAGYGSHGKATDNPMRVIRLSMPQACNSAVRRTSFARSGCRLNRGRLVRAVATGSTNGLFIRTRYLAGGTYLFDASGSMNLSDDRLNELCRAVPAAQVAYYSGGSDGPDETGAYGELVIYAANGRRAAECTNVWGGNEVDYFALRWLLQQPAPRVYIGDGQFCGGPEGQDVKAAALIIGAVANGEICWHRSIWSLEKSLGLCK